MGLGTTTSHNTSTVTSLPYHLHLVQYATQFMRSLSIVSTHICPSRAALPVPAYAAAGAGRHVARPSGSITRQSLRL